jgi:hypothetical protein
VRKQSADAEALVRWLAAEKAKKDGVVDELVAEIKHTSLQVGERPPA